MYDGVCSCGGWIGGGGVYGEQRWTLLRAISFCAGVPNHTVVGTSNENGASTMEARSTHEFEAQFLLCVVSQNGPHQQSYNLDIVREEGNHKFRIEEVLTEHTCMTGRNHCTNPRTQHAIDGYRGTLSMYLVNQGRITVDNQGLQLYRLEEGGIFLYK